MASGDDAQPRNFRWQYYEKMGFRCVQTARALEPLLREAPVDLQRLAQFVRLHPLPSLYRPAVWSLLLRVQSCHPEVAAYVAEQRRQTAADTWRHLRVLAVVGDDTPTPLRHWLGWLLNSGRLVRMQQREVARQMDSARIQVSYLVSDIVDPDHEAFFVSCRLWQLQQAVLDQLPQLLPWLWAQLEREDPPLAAHLAELGVLQRGETAPVHGWVESLYCGLLPPSSVERLVDKLCAGGDRLLPLVALSVFVTHRRLLMAVGEPSAARALLDRLPEEDSDRVASHALELWTKCCKVQQQ